MIVGRSELEPAQPGRQLAACRQDQHRQVGALIVKLAQHVQPVPAGKQEIQDDELVVVRDRGLQAPFTVRHLIDREPLDFQGTGQERPDSGLILDHE